MSRQILFKLSMGIIIIALIAWAISCAVNPVTGKRQFMLLTEADEIGLGQQTDAEIVQTYGLYENPELSAYINNLGKKMGSMTHRSNLEYSYKVLDTPVINAFAVPGGFVYFTRGILAYLNNEAELAGVMGHELGHVNARHSAQQYSKAQLAQLGLGLGIALSETFRKYAGIAQFGVGMMFLRFSRDNEREADALGVEYSTKMGYDSNHMANFFHTLERLNPGEDRSGLPGWFSTHPNPPDRIVAVQRDTKKWQAKVQQTNFAVNKDDYLKKINGIIVGEDPRQGYVENAMFYHPQLKFQFPVPSGWQVNNTPSQVQMFTQQQDAVIIFSLAKESTPTDAANQFVANTKANVLKSEGTRVSNLTAHRLTSEITTEQAVLGVQSYFIGLGNTVYVFHGYCANTQFSGYRSAFETTMSQFKQLTDPQKINVQPVHLAIKSAKAQGTVRQALQQFGVQQDKLEEMAIMNGLNLEDTIPANTLIKLIEK